MKALMLAEKTLGPKHLVVARTLNHLADVYCAQGLFAKAEHLYRRALDIFEKSQGPEQADVATTLNNLAQCLCDEGRCDVARGLYVRALGIMEKTLGPEHADVAKVLNNLGESYRIEGNLRKAKPLYSRALGMQKRRKDLIESKSLSTRTIWLLYTSSTGITTKLNHSSEKPWLSGKQLLVRTTRMWPLVNTI